MRFRTVIIGIFFIIFAIPSYTIIPSFITTEMNKLTGGTSSPMTYQILSSLGIPPIDTIVALIKYSFVGLIVAGFGVIAFGMVSKNIPKQKVAKLPTESEMQSEEYKPEVLYFLKERLAKGEITSRQYHDIRNVLEDNM